MFFNFLLARGFKLYMSAKYIYVISRGNTRAFVTRTRKLIHSVVSINRAIGWQRVGGNGIKPMLIFDFPVAGRRCACSAYLFGTLFLSLRVPPS